MHLLADLASSDETIWKGTVFPDEISADERILSVLMQPYLSLGHRIGGFYV